MSSDTIMSSSAPGSLEHTAPPAITIGLPCYGRPAFLKEALTHLAQQTFRDFEILVHENPSGAEDIRNIVQGFIQDGAPIRYHRHEVNIGILPNFMSVLTGVQSPLFMWAADDDLRHPEALAVLHAMLVADTGRHLAVSSVEVINTDGASIDHHTGFSRFTGNGDLAQSVLDFLAEPEICGKANLIYGLFRTPALNTAFATLGNALPDGWGPDLILLTAFLARFPIVGTDRVLFRKRTNNARAKPLTKRFPVDFGWPTDEFPELRAKILAAIPDDTTRARAGTLLDERQRHLTGFGGLRRGILKALSLEDSPKAVPVAHDAWAGSTNA